MAEVSAQFGIALARQATPGTPEPAIVSLAGTVNEAQGGVLGAPDVGDGDSGITGAFGRAFVEKGNIPGTYTPAPSNFSGINVETMDVAIQLAGSGAAAPSVDGDYQPVPGVDALLFAAGLEGAARPGGGWLYKVDSAIVPIVTAKYFTPLWSAVVFDAAASLSVGFTPGEVAVATFTLAGSFDQRIDESFPVFSLPQQVGRAAPVIRDAGHYWGIGDVLRGYSEATLTIDSEIQQFGDSNAPTGQRNRKTGRTVTFEATIYSDSADAAYEMKQIALETVPTDELYFQIGDPTADPAEAYEIRLPTPECRVTDPVAVGGAFSSTVTLVGVSETADSEFELGFPSS